MLLHKKNIKKGIVSLRVVNKSKQQVIYVGHNISAAGLFPQRNKANYELFEPILKMSIKHQQILRRGRFFLCVKISQTKKWM